MWQRVKFLSINFNYKEYLQQEKKNLNHTKLQKYFNSLSSRKNIENKRNEQNSRNFSKKFEFSLDQGEETGFHLSSPRHRDPIPRDRIPERQLPEIQRINVLEYHVTRVPETMIARKGRGWGGVTGSLESGINNKITPCYS